MMDKTAIQESLAVSKELIFLLSPQPWETIIDILALVNFEKLKSARQIRGLTIGDIAKRIETEYRFIEVLENYDFLLFYRTKYVPLRNYLLYFRLLGITFLDLLIAEPEKLEGKARELAEAKAKKENEMEEFRRIYWEYENEVRRNIPVAKNS